MDNSVVVSLRDIVVEFDGQRILDGLNLDIHDKEFVTLLGSSGCGKTTTLRLIAGFLEPNAGKVLLKGEDITGVPPYKRPVNTVFQKYALFPHLNVYDNIAFGLKLKKTPKPVIEKKVKAALKMVGMTDYEYRDVDSLSGGQQQRVSIARALAGDPSVILADEPTGALDSRTGREVMLFLQKLNAEGNTIILITHDNSIAAKAKRIIRITDGRIVYDGPAEGDVTVMNQHGAGEDAPEDERAKGAT